MILCDQYGYNVCNKLTAYINNFKIETIIKPGARYNNCISDISQLTKGYTRSDFIIIFAGSNNFYNYNRYPSFRDITQKVNFSSHTNIVFISVPIFNIDNETNRFIKRFNSNLEKYANKLNRYSEGNISYLNIYTKSFSVNFKESIFFIFILHLLSKDLKTDMTTSKYYEKQ